nr:MAG TPA: hypothetical protein [Caudoviricetes sp.]
MFAIFNFSFLFNHFFSISFKFLKGRDYNGSILSKL